MKKFFLFLILLILIGGSYVYYTKHMMPAISSEIIDTATGATTNLPECKITLQPIQAIKIDDVVKNCTEKKKMGMTPGGIGNMQEYIIADGQLLSNIYDPSVATGNAVCYMPNPEGKTLYEPVQKASLTTDSERLSISQSGYEAIMHILDKGSLGSIDVSPNVDSSACFYSNTTGLDNDCIGMKQTSAWTDGKNYFVAGWRHDMPNTLLYVINDKVYLPGTSNIGMHESNEVGKGVWQFIDVKNGKAIVKRMTNEQTHPDKKLPNGMESTSYTLQTCEIGL